MVVIRSDKDADATVKSPEPENVPDEK